MQSRGCGDMGLRGHGYGDIDTHCNIFRFSLKRWDKEVVHHVPVTERHLTPRQTGCGFFMSGFHVWKPICPMESRALLFSPIPNKCRSAMLWALALPPRRSTTETPDYSQAVSFERWDLRRQDRLPAEDKLRSFPRTWTAWTSWSWRYCMVGRPAPKPQRCDCGCAITRTVTGYGHTLLNPYMLFWRPFA